MVWVSSLGGGTSPTPASLLRDIMARRRIRGKRKTPDSGEGMTNDEARMSKEIRISKHEARKELVATGASCLARIIRPLSLARSASFRVAHCEGLERRYAIALVYGTETERPGSVDRASRLRVGPEFNSFRTRE